jgi:3',5'-cyclic AMP phosphodiesterase CpdA
MLIAQITDTHVREPDATATLGVDNNANLAAALQFLERLTPRPDVVLATGDLTNRGKREEYAQLRELLHDFSIPLFVIPGNHDDRDLLREAFREDAYVHGVDAYFHYVVDDYPVRLVGVDTTVADHHDGALCEARIGWLAERLVEAPHRPTLIFMHHPPFKTGIWWVDGIGLLRGSAELQRVVNKHPQVKLIVCGHIHRCVQSQLGEIPVSVAPSTVHQVCLDVAPESPPAIVAEPPALKLHYWNGTAFVSHTAYFDLPDRPVDLTQFMDWKKRRKIIRNGQGTPKQISY